MFIYYQVLLIFENTFCSYTQIKKKTNLYFDVPILFFRYCTFSMF